MSRKSRPLPPSDTADKFVLRLPDGMRERIKREADTNNRSMNAEIVATLEERYPQKTTFTDFMRDWVAPIAAAKTDEEKIRLVEAANFEAEMRDAGYRVGLDVDQMKPFITFLRFDIPEFVDEPDD
nr:Arc family DNA-binding protein [Ochrobactrum sp. UNC390CL2Tsu3S39]